VRGNGSCFLFLTVSPCHDAPKHALRVDYPDKSLRSSSVIKYHWKWNVSSSVPVAIIPIILAFRNSYHYNHWWSEFPSLPASLYFDMREGRFKYTDGAYAFTFEDHTPVFGFEPTGVPGLIRSILMDANSLEYIEPVE